MHVSLQVELIFLNSAYSYARACAIYSDALYIVVNGLTGKLSSDKKTTTHQTQQQRGKYRVLIMA